MFKSIFVASLLLAISLAYVVHQETRAPEKVMTEQEKTQALMDDFTSPCVGRCGFH